jgi:hypothetical protein
MGSLNRGKSPRQIIDKIRTHSFLLDLDSESEMVREGAANLQTQLNNALRLLSQDLYSKQSHFVLELVQNADDNQYGTGVTPHLRFRVAPTRFMAINNEAGFREENVKAICSVGASSKSKNKVGYIGEKGIGFKSVFTVSDAPEIHSNGFHFRFDRTDPGNLLGYVVPHWCDPPADVEPSGTTIILPAAKGYEFDARSLDELDARLLLFLNKLRCLTLEQDGGRLHFRREDKEVLSILTTVSEPSGKPAVSEDLRYVRASLTFPMTGEFSDEMRPGIERSTVVLAFPVNATGEAKPEPASHVFAFLPVRQMGFKFPIQADFILNSSRGEVRADKRWNVLLRVGIASVFSSAVDTFKTIEELALTYLKYIPADGEVADPFFRTVRTEIIQQLSTRECLLSASGVWRKPCELRIADENFRMLFPSELALELFGFDYVDPRVQGGNNLLRSLGASDAGTAEVVAVFSAKGEWLRARPMEWRARFFAYVANNQQALVAAGLFKSPCLPVSDGSFVVPAKSHVFFPLSKRKKYGFEDELVFVDNELYEQAQTFSERVVGLFAAMQVRPDKPYEMVNAHILPRHKGESWKTSNFKALVGHLRYVRDKLRDYLDAAKADGKTETQAFEILRDGIWIGTKHNTDGTWRFDKIGQLYLSKEYKPTFCIESLLSDALAPAQLVSPDYLGARTKDVDADTVEWRQFFAILGVRVAPAVVPSGGDWSCSRELQLLLDSPHSAVRKAVLECISMYWSSYSSRMSYNLGVGRSSYIARDTKFVNSLRTTAIPTKKRTSVPLAESYYPTAELRRLLGDGVPYLEAELSEPMLDACRVTHRLDAKALIKRLRQLKAEAGGTLRQVQAIYRTLDERLWDTDAAYIRKAFTDDGLIQVKGAGGKWLTPDEVAWRSSGPFLDSLYPPLQSTYRDFSRFFVDRLGVPKELPTKKWVEALLRVDEIADPDDRKAEALAIYRRANRDLSSRFGREARIPDWVESFQTEAVYINHRCETVPNNEYLFANDAPGIASLFEGEGDLSFLAIPPVEVPRLSRLLGLAEVSKLSEAITREVKSFESGRVDEELTRRVRRSVHFLARVVYSKQPEVFERALEEGRFAGLRKLKVVEVATVAMIVSLAGHSRTTAVDIGISNDDIIYRAGAKSVKDMLAMELCDFLGASVDFADTFTRILMENEVDNIEDFFGVRNIGQLPTDLLQALDRHGEPDANDNPAASADSAADEEVGAPQQAASEEPFELLRTEARSEPEALEVTENGTALPRDATPASRGTVRRNGMSARRDAGANGAGTEDSKGDPFVSPAEPESAAPRSAHPAPAMDARSISGRHARPDAPASAASVSATDGKGPPATVGDPLADENGKRRTRSSRVPFQRSTGGRSSQLGGPARTSPSMDGTSSAPPLVGESLRRFRKKPGRLLSYVIGPNEADKTSSADAEAKAAAREATGREAVRYFMTTLAGRWKSLTEMPHNNPGFDVLALTHDDEQEYIEVKGQSGAWTEEGVALTPTELLTAQAKGDRYWLCVVEFVQDDQRRRLHLLRDPFGLTQQFRFDVGWKSAAESAAAAPVKPRKDMGINMADVGRGRILSVRDKGRFFNLHVMLEDGRQVNKLFNPATMTLSKDPMWQA